MKYRKFKKKINIGNQIVKQLYRMSSKFYFASVCAILLSNIDFARSRRATVGYATFYLVQEEATFAESKSRCESRGLHIATIKDRNVATSLRKLIAKQADSK